MFKMQRWSFVAAGVIAAAAAAFVVIEDGGRNFRNGAEILSVFLFSLFALGALGRPAWWSAALQISLAVSVLVGVVFFDVYGFARYLAVVGFFGGIANSAMVAIRALAVSVYKGVVTASNRRTVTHQAS